MVSILHSLHNLITGTLLLHPGGSFNPNMWPFRWASRDQEAPPPCCTSQTQPLDLKSVGTALEKLRGYRDLAKVSSPCLPA